MSTIKGYDAWKLQGPPEAREDAEGDAMVGEEVTVDGDVGRVIGYFCEPDDYDPDDHGPQYTLVYEVEFLSGVREMTAGELEDARVDG